MGFMNITKIDDVYTERIINIDYSDTAIPVYFLNYGLFIIFLYAFCKLVYFERYEALSVKSMILYMICLLLRCWAVVDIAQKICYAACVILLCITIAAYWYCKNCEDYRRYELFSVSYIIIPVVMVYASYLREHAVFVPVKVFFSQIECIKVGAIPLEILAVAAQITVLRQIDAPNKWLLYYSGMLFLYYILYMVIDLWVVFKNFKNIYELYYYMQGYQTISLGRMIVLDSLFPAILIVVLVCKHFAKRNRPRHAEEQPPPEHAVRPVSASVQSLNPQAAAAALNRPVPSISSRIQQARVASASGNQNMEMHTLPGRV